MTVQVGAISLPHAYLAQTLSAHTSCLINQTFGDLENGPSPTRSATDASGHHVIRHAQLVSDIRRAKRTDPMFDYSNVCYWRDLACRLHRPPDQTGSRPSRDYVDQLACRALILAVSPTPAPHTNPGILLGTPQDVDDDTLASCRRFIDASYERTGHGNPSGSFLDAYDIIAAAVVYACLSRRAVASLGRPAEPMEVIHKASTLVTQISARFPTLGDFHRLFMALSSNTVSDHGKKAYLATPSNHAVTTGSNQGIREDCILTGSSLEGRVSGLRHTPDDAAAFAPVYQNGFQLRVGTGSVRGGEDARYPACGTWSGPNVCLRAFLATCIAPWTRDGPTPMLNGRGSETTAQSHPWPTPCFTQASPPTSSSYPSGSSWSYSAECGIVGMQSGVGMLGNSRTLLAQASNQNTLSSSLGEERREICFSKRYKARDPHPPYSFLFSRSHSIGQCESSLYFPPSAP